ncbi:MAG TPA: Hsp20/alpha crystallin family protein [candidate division Zixibacteria bacterium]|nr:Hsp20/alpha crystallin family protein [candidate division Zixibacteria bacterium]
MTNVARRETNGMRNRLPSPFFEDFFHWPPAPWEPHHWPRVDVRETSEDATLLFEAPGMRKEDLEVQVGNNRLTVSGERRLEADDSYEGWGPPRDRDRDIQAPVYAPVGYRPALGQG